jgi:hypothetical protein
MRLFSGSGRRGSTTGGADAPFGGTAGTGTADDTDGTVREA